jgi:hypothetical protein
MSCFAPYNLYAFLAARGAFLRPDVRALLERSPVGPLEYLANPDGAGQMQGAAFFSRLTRKRLDALLFPDGLDRVNVHEGSKRK